MLKKLLFAVSCACVLVNLSHVSVGALTLSSLTLDAQNAEGRTRNAPGGIFSTNLADPNPQIGVMSEDGVFLNDPWNAIELGEIAIDLKPGLNTFKLFASTHYSGQWNPFYGLTMFFDHVASPPQIAVYNENGGSGDFLVQEKDTPIIGCARGGLFFDKAPGLSRYVAEDGSSVAVTAFTVDHHMSSTQDLVSWGHIRPDGYADIVAEITLDYTPVPEPGTLLLVGAGLVGLVSLRRKQ